MTANATPIINVLIIEDSKADAILLQRALHKPDEMSYATQHARSLEQALTMLGERSFDVALLDRTLPDASGFTGLQSIQNMAPKLPVIFLTGHEDEKTALDSIKQGAQDYLLKESYNEASVRRAIRYAICRKDFESELIRRAHYDVLTGLANRGLFESNLTMAMSRLKRHNSGGLAVFFLDLDGFKQVNDTLGHLAGDRLLTEIGQRIRQSLRAHDIAARFGGDEFALLIENVETRAQMLAIAEKIIHVCGQPISVSGRDVTVGVSIGVAACGRDNPAGCEDLLRHADQAMYEAKAVPESAVCFYGDNAPALASA